MMSNAPQLIALGYVADPGRGPLSIVYKSDDDLVLIEILTSQAEIDRRLQSGESVDDVLANRSALTMTKTEMPLSSIQELVWREGQSSMQVVYEDQHHKTRTKSTHLASAKSRNELLKTIEMHIGRPLESRSEPTGILRVVWSQLLGAFMTIMGGIVLFALWDQRAIARVRWGWLTNLLGLNGCLFVAACIVIACLWDAWRHLHPRPQVHFWRI